MAVHSRLSHLRQPEDIENQRVIIQYYIPRDIGTLVVHGIPLHESTTIIRGRGFGQVHAMARDGISSCRYDTGRFILLDHTPFIYAYTSSANQQ